MRYMRKSLSAVLANVLLAGSTLGATVSLGGFDGWSVGEMAVLSSMRLSALPAAPQDPSNAYEASAAAASLGKRIFFDSRFSGNGKVSCAGCHQPERQFQDGVPLGVGMGTGIRRTMPVVGAGHSPFLFWDGRKDSLWSQALGPLEASVEHGGNRLAYAHLLDAHYRAGYEAVFGAFPAVSHLPKDASPLGTPAQQAAWNALDERSRREVSRVFANMGKAIAAYEKSLRFSESRMDRYVEGLVRRDAAAASVLSPSEKNGLRIFIGKGQCITCHGGPLLTDQYFHNTGVAPLLSASPGLGRRAAIAAVQEDEFNCLGQFSDARPGQCAELEFLAADDPAMEGAFKTPGLRNVTLRAPFMHAGQIASIDAVVRHYANAPAAAVGRSELKPVSLSEQEARDLAAFLGTLVSL